MKNRRKRRRRGEVSTIGAILEAAKYTTKSADYLVKKTNGEIDEERTDEAVYVLSTSIRNRRLISYGGVFKAAHKRLNLDNVEGGDLLHTEVDARAGLPDLILLNCTWSGNGGYEVTQGKGRVP